MFFTPPSSPLVDLPLAASTDDTFPEPTELPADLVLDEQGLTTLEKIYLFSRSNAPFHRIFICHALPSFLDNVSPQDAVDYVLPLLSALAMDDGALLALLGNKLLD
jgi:serine/threonine-protein phosphatase 4 regulatory subunit 1